jgi:hypothetical protein
LHAAALLTDGTVLVVGGDSDVQGGCLATAVSYDPAANSWTTVTGMATGRTAFGSAVLQDGRVLAAASGCALTGPSAELFDPIAGTWSPTGNMAVRTRVLPTATTLRDGRVLVVGGADGPGASAGMVGLAEIYSPVRTVTFDDLANPNRPLNGEYGGIDWGTDAWFLSAPWGLFTTNSISFPGPRPIAESFAFLAPHVVLSVDAYNGGASATTVTVACAGNPPVSQDVAAGQIVTIATGWSIPCTTVTVGSSNSWDTNFDNLTYR